MNGLGAYLLHRLLLAFLTLGAILLVSYVLLRIAPGDPARSSMLGEAGSGGEHGGLSADRAALAKDDIIRKRLHFDKPAVVGFWLWVKDVARGELGLSVSVDKGRPVRELILERLPVTLRLNVIALSLIYLLAIPAGILAGIRPDGRFDRISTGVLFFLYSLPSLWVALVLQASLCEGGLFPLFPLKGLSPDVAPGTSTWRILGQSAWHYVLPVLCMTLGSFAGLSRYVRSAMIDAERSDFIRTARAKGVPEFDVVMHHAFRNTLVLLATLFSGLLPALVTGSILIEHVFSIPGMGQLSMMAMSSRDVPLMMTLFAFTGILTLLGMLLADVAYVLADPRISFRSRI